MHAQRPDKKDRQEDRQKDRQRDKTARTTPKNTHANADERKKKTQGGAETWVKARSKEYGSSSESASKMKKH